MEFLDWWNKTGSGLQPRPEEDTEEHAKFVAYMAWQAALETTKREAKDEH